MTVSRRGGGLSPTALNAALVEAEVVTSSDVREIVRVTQAEYDGLTPDPETLYVVVG